ncbi:MAG: hypothetical protein U0361_17675 [Nitrospiraceae bacterium]
MAAETVTIDDWWPGGWHIGAATIIHGGLDRRRVDGVRATFRMIQEVLATVSVEGASGRDQVHRHGATVFDGRGVPGGAGYRGL